MPYNDETFTPAVDSRLRSMARRKGYTLHKSRQSLSADNLGGYMIVDPSTNACLEGARYDCASGFVEEWLKDREPGPLARL